MTSNSQCVSVYKNLGAKVFMDAHEPVTLEEGDRYPLAPPSFVRTLNGYRKMLSDLQIPFYW